MIDFLFSRIKLIKTIKSPMNSYKMFFDAMDVGDSCIEDVEYMNQGDLEADGLVQILDHHNRTLLHHASEIGRFEFAKDLIDAKANVNYQDDTLVTPLHLASRGGHLRIVKMLIQHGAEVNATDCAGFTPLHEASALVEDSSNMVGHSSIMAELLMNGASFDEQIDLNTKDQKGKTSLDWIFSRNDAFVNFYGLIKQLIANGAKLNFARIPRPWRVEPHNREYLKSIKDLDFFCNITNKLKLKPLIRWTIEGSEKDVNRLLFLGANIESTDQFRNTALHFAALKGKLPIVRALLHDGAEVNVSNLQNETPLALAVKESNVSIIKLLLEHGASATTVTNYLHLIEENIGGKDIVRRLIENGANISAQDCKKNTVLHLALLKRWPDLARYVIEKGIDINLRNVYDDNPLSIAYRNGYKDIAIKLLNQGAIASDIDMMEVLYVHRDQFPIVSLLLDNGAKGDSVKVVEFLEAYQDTEQEKLVPVLTKLILHGADTQAKDQCGNTALHIASMNNHELLVDVLIQNGSNINASNQELDTPLELAVKKGHLSVVDKLLENGADCEFVDILKLLKDTQEMDKQMLAAVVTKLINCDEDFLHVKDENKNSVLHLASSMGHFKLVKSLIDCGAENNATNSENNTPLNLAFAKGHQSIVDLLLKKGSTANLPNLFQAMPRLSKENDSCSLCFEPKNGIFAFQPCGHANACELCCMKLTYNEDRHLRKCPICRSDITNFQRIYV